MLKTTESSSKSVPNRNDGSKSAFSRINNSRPISRKNNGNSEVDRFSVGGNGVKHAKKSGKLFKSGKSKSEKMSKFWNLAKLKKKLSKNGNLNNFDAIGAGPKFLTPDAKITFNRLWLAFTKLLILWHFNLKYHIWIETDALSYVIGGVLSQLIPRTNSNGIVIKTDLG